MFMRGAKVEQVVRVLEDFDKHKDYYPEIIASRTVARNGNTVGGIGESAEERYHGRPRCRRYRAVFTGQARRLAWRIRIDEGLGN